MGKTPRIALASIFMAGMTLTGCESCSLFGEHKPLRQNQFATAPSNPTPANGTGTSGWQNQPKGWATTPANAAAQANAGQPTSNLDSAFGTRTPGTATGLPNMNSGASPAFGQSTVTPTSTTGYDRSTQSTARPYDTYPRAMTPQTNAPVPDWNRDTTQSSPQSSLGGADKAPTVANQGSTTSQGYNTMQASPPAPTFNTQGNGARDTRYPSQYQTAPSPNDVKSLTPGQGDE